MRELKIYWLRADPSSHKDSGKSSKLIIDAKTSIGEFPEITCPKKDVMEKEKNE
jgi:hypothetical protein